MFKWMLTLLMAVAVGVIGVNSGFGDGFFGFRSQAKAEQALDEARNIETAMDAYALKYGNGKVEFGDVAAGEDLLKYLKHFDLVMDKVGTDSSTTGIDRWVLDTSTNQLLGVVANQKTCSYMNSIKDKTPLSDIVPECGSVEAESSSCCQATGGQYETLLQTP